MKSISLKGIITKRNIWSIQFGFSHWGGRRYRDTSLESPTNSESITSEQPIGGATTKASFYKTHKKVTPKNLHDSKIRTTKTNLISISVHLSLKMRKNE